MYPIIIAQKIPSRGIFCEFYSPLEGCPDVHRGGVDTPHPSPLLVKERGKFVTCPSPDKGRSGGVEKLSGW